MAPHRAYRPIAKAHEIKNKQYKIDELHQSELCKIECQAYLLGLVHTCAMTEQPAIAGTPYQVAVESGNYSMTEYIKNS